MDDIVAILDLVEYHWTFTGTSAKTGKSVRIPTGRRVVGIDSSPAMLAQARVRAVEEGVELDLREGDIRELEIEEPAALIYCRGRSLLHLPTSVGISARCTGSTAKPISSGAPMPSRRHSYGR
jgi:trans-aconitate methyltransferase